MQNGAPGTTRDGIVSIESAPIDDRIAMENRWDTGRTEAFSDGVFAVAITLLVLDIDVSPDSHGHFLRAIADEWPSYLGFATSFLTVGALWMAHHSMFRRLRYGNSAVIRLNLFLLMAVSFLPFPTRLVAEAIKSDSDERVAVIFYGLTLFVITALFAALWAVVVRDGGLLREEVTEDEARRIMLAATPSLGFYAGIILLAILLPKVAAFGLLAIAIIAIVRVREDPAQARDPERDDE